MLQYNFNNQHNPSLQNAAASLFVRNLSGRGELPRNGQNRSHHGADNTISLGVAVALSNTYDPACRLPLNYWLPPNFSLAPRN